MRQPEYWVEAEIHAKKHTGQVRPLQKDFDEGDKKESALSGICGEVGEIMELLSEMRQAREDKEAVKRQEKAEITALEAEKEEIGAMLVNKSLHRRAPGPSRGSTSEAGTQSKVGKGNGKRKRESFDVGDEMMSFSEAIKESELLRAAVENKKLELEEKRLRIVTEERGKDREESKAEREAQTQLELDKFRLMMESQASMMKEIVRTIKRDPENLRGMPRGVSTAPVPPRTPRTPPVLPPYPPVHSLLKLVVDMQSIEISC